MKQRVRCLNPLDNSDPRLARIVGLAVTMLARCRFLNTRFTLGDLDTQAVWKTT